MTLNVTAKGHTKQCGISGYQDATSTQILRQTGAGLSLQINMLEFRKTEYMSSIP